MIKRDRKAQKTVYVLGAGFSREAGCPLQAEILYRIFSFKIENLSISDDPFNIATYFDHSRRSVLEFIERVFPHGVNPSLEDVYTLLDQTIETRCDCAPFTWQQLEEVRINLNRTILFIFHWTTARSGSPQHDFYRSIASDLILVRLEQGQKGDPFSIISLNWDSLLEDDLYWCIEQVSGHHLLDIDYCCYTTPMYKGGYHQPSPTQKAIGIYNLKILKLHGSANWLICPNCRRLFTGIGEQRTVWELYLQKRACPLCQRTEEAAKPLEVKPPGPILEPYFVTPTYLKRFENPHILMTWHNAFIELSEADEIIFIGYSLPESDYHIRTLLRRAIRRERPIHVILSEKDGPENVRGKVKNSQVASRYLDFFGRERLDYDFSGVKGYFQARLGKQKLGNRLSTIRRRLKRTRRSA